MVYTDRPGIVAIYGQKFGEAGINIAGMQIARRARRRPGARRADAWTRRCPTSCSTRCGAAIQADLFRQIEITES